MGNDEQLSAAVLTGGESRRMGTDKALIDFDGEPQLARILRRLEQVATDRLIVGDRPPYRAFSVPVVADYYPGTGTLGGIATALRHATQRYVLIVACDMPLLSVALLRAMAEHERDYDVLVPVTAGVHDRQGGSATLQTLHAIYSRGCLEPIERQLAGGDLKVVRFFDSVRVVELDERWVRRYDPELRSFVNANTPAELEAAHRARQMRDVSGGGEGG